MCVLNPGLLEKLHELLPLKDTHQGWRDGSVGKSTDCSSKGPEFNSQQPHGGSQASTMDLMSSSRMFEDSYSVLIDI